VHNDNVACWMELLLALIIAPDSTVIGFGVLYELKSGVPKQNTVDFATTTPAVIFRYQHGKMKDRTLIALRECAKTIAQWHIESV